MEARVGLETIRFVQLSRDRKTMTLGILKTDPSLHNTYDNPDWQSKMNLSVNQPSPNQMILEGTVEGKTYRLTMKQPRDWLSRGYSILLPQQMDECIFKSRLKDQRTIYSDQPRCYHP